MQAALPQDRAKDKLECQEEIAQGDDHDHLGGIPDRVSGKEKRTIWDHGRVIRSIRRSRMVHM